jgi:hypothetical protein
VKAAYDLAASKTSNTGTVTSVATSGAITGGTITTSGTISARSATTGQTGVVQLSTSVSSTSTTLAATASAAKSAYDRGTTGVNNAATAQSTANTANTNANTALGRTNYGVIAAFVAFRGTSTVAAYHSAGVSSVSDNGTGDYTVNFSYNMGTSSYATSAEGLDSSAGSNYFGKQSWVQTRASTSVRVRYAANDSTGTPALDTSYYSVIVVK